MSLMLSPTAADIGHPKVEVAVCRSSCGLRRVCESQSRQEWRLEGRQVALASAQRNNGANSAPALVNGRLNGNVSVDSDLDSYSYGGECVSQLDKVVAVLSSMFIAA